MIIHTYFWSIGLKCLWRGKGLNCLRRWKCSTCLWEFVGPEFWNVWTVCVLNSDMFEQCVLNSDGHTVCVEGVIECHQLYCEVSLTGVEDKPFVPLSDPLPYFQVYVYPSLQCTSFSRKKNQGIFMVLFVLLSLKITVVQSNFFQQHPSTPFE